jgi:hypothetical protein
MKKPTPIPRTDVCDLFALLACFDKPLDTIWIVEQPE